jgi:hypothetical protein
MEVVATALRMRSGMGWRTATRVNRDRTGPLSLVQQSRLCGQLPPSRATSQPSGLRLSVGVHETTFRVNVRWVTPLGEETASTS